MSAIIPFAPGSQLPAYMQNKAALAAINKDVVSGPSFTVLSIKGKVFTLVKDKTRKVLTRPDDADEVLQFINLSVLRANTKSRVYYAEGYTEGESEGAKPTCQSYDGVTPTANSASPQAKKCGVCPHAVWGSKVRDDGTPGKGTECTVNTRLAVVDPDHMDEPILLRVPAGSRANFADAVKIAEGRGIPYNALVLKVGFDKEAPSPKLTFKPTGLLDDAAYAKATELYDDKTVRDIVGLTEEAPEKAAVTVDSAELDAAIAAKAAVAQAKAPAKALAAPKAKPAAPPPAETPVSEDALDAVMEAPAPAPAPAKAAAKPAAKPAAPPPVKAPVAAPAADMENLLGDLDNLLGMTDD